MVYVLNIIHKHFTKDIRDSLEALIVQQTDDQISHIQVFHLLAELQEHIKLLSHHKVCDIRLCILDTQRQ